MEQSIANLTEFDIHGLFRGYRLGKDDWTDPPFEKLPDFIVLLEAIARTDRTEIGGEVKPEDLAAVAEDVNSWQASLSHGMRGIADVLSRIKPDEDTAAIPDEYGKLIDACRVLTGLATLNRYFEQKAAMLKDLMAEEAEEEEAAHA